MKKWIFAASVFVSVLIVAGINLSKPALRVDVWHTSATVHLETLGEYPATIQRMRIEERPSGRVVFEAAKASGTPQLTNFQLVVGLNSAGVLDPEHGTYQVIEPEGKSFVLHADQMYRITVWRKAWIPSSATLEFL